MEIYDHYKIFHDLREQWHTVYNQGTKTLEDYVKEVRLKSKNDRLEWIMVNAGKIYSFKAICRYFNKFVNKDKDKSNLKDYIDEDNVIKANIKSFNKLVNIIDKKTKGSDSIKEDELCSLIK